MDYSDFLELARSRQSIRTFESRPVDMRLVEQLLLAAQQAPTSCNHQLNRYVVVTDASLRRALHEQAGAPRTVVEAPTSIVVVVRMGWNHNKFSLIQSAGMAAQNILLAATSLGLDAVIQAGIGDTEKIRELLGIDDGHLVLSIISLGYGDEVFPHPPRLPTEAIYGADRFSEAPYLRYPRRPVRADYGAYSNDRSPDAVWDPDGWSLDAIGCFRGLAVWHTSPRPGVHRPTRWRGEIEQEIAFFRRHLGRGHRILEVLAFSGAYGARLVADPDLSELPWEVFELSPYHREFIDKRCELEGVKSPDAYHWATDLGVDLGVRFDRILLAGSWNHLPRRVDLAGFLERHLVPGGLALVSLRNALSFQTPLYWRLRRGQVWNFGPFAPRTVRGLEKRLGAGFRRVERVGLSLVPWSLGRVWDDWRAGFCRTVCLALERR